MGPHASQPWGKTQVQDIMHDIMHAHGKAVRTGARGGQCHHGAVTAEAAHGLYHGRVGVPLQPLCEAVQPVGAL